MFDQEHSSEPTPPKAVVDLVAGSVSAALATLRAHVDPAHPACASLEEALGHLHGKRLTNLNGSALPKREIEIGVPGDGAEGYSPVTSPIDAQAGDPQAFRSPPPLVMPPAFTPDRFAKKVLIEDVILLTLFHNLGRRVSTQDLLAVLGGYSLLVPKATLQAVISRMRDDGWVVRPKTGKDRDPDDLTGSYRVEGFTARVEMAWKRRYPGTPLPQI